MAAQTTLSSAPVGTRRACAAGTEPRGTRVMSLATGLRDVRRGRHGSSVTTVWAHGSSDRAGDRGDHAGWSVQPRAVSSASPWLYNERRTFHSVYGTCPDAIESPRFPE